MTCTRLCKKIGIGSHAYIEGAKNCSECVLFLITESDICACCGTELPYKNTQSKENEVIPFAFRANYKGIQHHFKL